MDEARREALKNELDAALAEREELNTFIAVLSRRLGISEPSQAATTESPVETSTTDPNRPVADSIREGQFYGMSGPKAARAVLELVGRSRPLKTDAIFEAITKGGVKIGSSGTLYRSLFRDPDFHKVGRGLWGLTEWYPAASRKRSGTEDGTLNGADAEAPETDATEPEDEETPTS